MYLYTAFAISGKDVKNMMYPFLTLNDDTEITHSEMKPDGQVKVYIETPLDASSSSWVPMALIRPPFIRMIRSASWTLATR